MSRNVTISRQSSPLVLKSKALVGRYSQGAGMPGKRSAKSSLCYKPSSHEYHFHKCTTANPNNTVCFVENDLNAISFGLTDFSTLLPNLKLLIDDAKKGLLLEEDPRFGPLVKPCATQPDVWELRWEIWGLHFRMYYSEDGNRIPEFVALSFTEKVTKGLSDDEIKNNQDEAIKIAQDRFDDYESLRWGHAEQECRYCKWD